MSSRFQLSSHCRRPNLLERLQPFFFVFVKKRVHFSACVCLPLRLRESNHPIGDHVFVWVCLSSPFHKPETSDSKLQVCVATVKKTQCLAYCFSQGRALCSVCSAHRNDLRITKCRLLENVHHLERPHAQSFFPIFNSFGINLISFFD